MGETPENENSVRPFQFGIRHLLLWTAAVGLVLGAGVQWGIAAGCVAGSVLLLVGIWAYTRSVGCVVKAAGLCLFVLFLVVLGFANTSGVRPAARQNGCMSNMQQICIALANYEAIHGSYPPAYTTDAAGRRLHSWRTLILPFLEEGASYARIDQSQPWDAPGNLAISNLSIPALRCPESRPSKAPNYTSYVAVVGPETMWPGPVGRKLEEVTDGISKTIFIVEVAHTNIAWAEPLDLTFEEVIAAHRRGDLTGIASFHPKGKAAVGFPTAQVTFLDPAEIDEETLRALFTVAGGEDVGSEEL